MTSLENHPMKIRSTVLFAGLAPLASGIASAALTHRWALNETSLNPDATGVLESVSSSTVGQVFGTVTGVVGNPGG